MSLAMQRKLMFAVAPTGFSDCRFGPAEGSPWPKIAAPAVPIGSKKTSEVCDSTSMAPSRELPRRLRISPRPRVGQGMRYVQHGFILRTQGFPHSKDKSAVPRFYGAAPRTQTKMFLSCRPPRLSTTHGRRRRLRSQASTRQRNGAALAAA